jgi:exonuclease VII small subunit
VKFYQQGIHAVKMMEVILQQKSDKMDEISSVHRLTSGTE